MRKPLYYYYFSLLQAALDLYHIVFLFRSLVRACKPPRVHIFCYLTSSLGLLAAENVSMDNTR